MQDQGHGMAHASHCARVATGKEGEVYTGRHVGRQKVWGNCLWRNMGETRGMFVSPLIPVDQFLLPLL